MGIFQNVTKGSLTKGSAMLVVLAGAVGMHLTKWGLLGFYLNGVPLWCFAALASTGGVLFFLGPMIFGSASVQPSKNKDVGGEMFLYLRPFELDARGVLQLTVGASAGAVVYLVLIEGLWWPLTFAPLLVNINKEQNFQDAFATLGSFIAFGKPGEWLQPIGASRVYAQDDWKQEVRSYLAQARLVIVRPGESKSIRWEIEQVLEVVPPERIVFYLRFRGWKKRKQRAYEAFRNHLQARRSLKLPARLRKEPYLILDASWTPYFIREANRPTELVRQIFSRAGDVSKDNLRPVLEALGIELSTPPNNLFNNFTTVMLWLVALFSIGLVFASLVIATIKVMTALMLFLLD